MKRFLLPLLLMILGIAGGGGAAYFLGGGAPEEAVSETCVPVADAELTAIPEAPPEGAEISGRDYAKLNNQFVVPVVTDGKVSALVVLSLSVEVLPGSKEDVFTIEPKLRDRFLQVLFDHANLGGFDGAFTSGPNLKRLREALLVAARDTLGPSATDVLIMDIVRQDV